MPPMRKKAKKSEEVVKSESSNSEDSHDEETTEEPKPKATKKNADDAEAATSCVHRSDKNMDGNPTWKLDPGKERVVTVSDFKGKTYINIRDYYEKGGKLLPGKGIALTIEQWKVLGECFTDVNAVLAKK